VFLIPLWFTAAHWLGYLTGVVRRRASTVPCFCLGKQLRERVWDFLFVGLFFSGWIQTAGAASGRLKGRMTEQRVVLDSQKANCCWGAESRETSRNRNARFLCRLCVCVCVNCFSDSFGFFCARFLDYRLSLC
jgi:hypothetical protein